MGKRTRQDRIRETFFKLNKKRDPSGTLKIFADEVNPTSSYKSFLLSPNDTCQWIIKETLEKYGLKNEDPLNYCLVQIQIPNSDQFLTTPIKRIILRDNDCPLQICWSQNDRERGSTVFKMIECSPECLTAREHESIVDRTFYESNPMLIEIDSDGRDLSTPRLIKVPLNTSWIGRAHKSRETYLSNYIIIEGTGIDRDHCLIQNQRGTITIFPKGETRYQDQRMTTPFILEHGQRIRFGRSLTFRFYDPLAVDQIKPTNIEMNSKTKVNVLPGLIEVPEETETVFLDALFDRYPLTKVLFRLSPVYMLYMALRYRLSSWVKPQWTLEQKQESLVDFLSVIEQRIEKKFQEYQDNVAYMVYWIGNVSEFIFLLKYDRNLTNISEDLRVRLHRSLETNFYHLIKSIQYRLERCYPSLIDLRDDLEESMFDEIDDSVPETNWLHNDSRSNLTLKEILTHLSALMTLLRKSRINPTITIGVFAQIFQTMNTWIVNRFLCQNELQLCSYVGGERVFARLRFIRRWAQIQGLELIVDRHLMKAHQLCAMLMSPKRDTLDAQNLCSDPNWSLNSIQIRHVFNRYVLTRTETPPSTAFVRTLLLTSSQRVNDRLLEDEYSRLPFVLPDDGYSCENLRGIPDNLLEFLEMVNRDNCCRLFLNPYSLGYWTEFLYMTHVKQQTSRRNQETYRLETIILKKHENSLGLSIVSAKSDWQQSQGIYIQDIVCGSSAQIDGRLEPGDQILAVEQTSLIDMTQEQAADILRQSGLIVTLKVLKNAAQHQGLGSLFVRPNESPIRSPKFSYVSRINEASREVVRNVEEKPIPKTTQFENSKIESSKVDNSKMYRSNPTLNSTNRWSFVSREDVPPSRNSVRLPRATSQMIISPTADKFEVKVSWKENHSARQTSTEKENDDFSERLKRRLEEFENLREIDRSRQAEILRKSREEIEKRSREERERSTRVDEEIKFYRNRHLTEDELNFEAEREEKRLSKHISFPLFKK